MKKTLVLSMMLCGSVSLVLGGCAKDDEPGTTATTTTTGNTNPGETDEDSGDGDGDTGDGDGDPAGDGDADTGDSLTTTFVPDDGDMASVSSCDPFAQDCPEGEKCVPYGSTGSNWDANKCVPVDGSGSPGDPCISGGTAAGTDDCGADSHCWDVMDVDGQLVGVCTQFCTGTPDDPICDSGTSCLIANEGSITLCIQTCDPLLQDCGAGLACFWANNGFNCIFTTSDIPLGEPCGFINDCVAGTGCLDATILPMCNGQSCCGSFCTLSDPLCPQMGTECADFFEAGQAPPGYEDVGVCIIPGA